MDRKKRARRAPACARPRRSQPADVSLARAWLDTVVNPILEHLPVSLDYARRRSWTWRYRSGSFEIFHPVPALVLVRYHPNLKLLGKRHRGIADLAEAHDDALDTLARALEHTHARLINHPSFRGVFQQAATECAAKKVADWWGVGPRDEADRLAGQLVINNVKEAFPHESYGPFWDQHGETFLALRTHPELAPEFQQADAAGAQLTDAIAGLMERLEGFRMELADSHGIPPVAPLEDETLVRRGMF